MSDELIDFWESMSRVERFLDEHADRAPAEVWHGWQCEWHGRPYPPGRNDMPAALFDLWIVDRELSLLGRDFYAHAVADAWVNAEIPMQSIDRSSWLELWGMSRYVHDGQDAPRRRRRRPLRLYRVARDAELDAGTVGLSWTHRVRFAETFLGIRHGRYPSLGGHRILSTLADPAHVLGELTRAWTGGRGEPEIIADIRPENVEVFR